MPSRSLPKNARFNRGIDHAGRDTRRSRRKRGGGHGEAKKRQGLYSMRPHDYFEKPRRRDVSAAVTDAANELRRRLTEYSQYVTVYSYTSISAARGIFDTSRVPCRRSCAAISGTPSARVTSNVKRLFA